MGEGEGGMFQENSIDSGNFLMNGESREATMYTTHEEEISNNV